MAITNNTCNWIRLRVETYGFPLDSRLVEFLCLCSASHENTPKNYLPTYYFSPFSVRMSLEVSHKCSVSSVYKSVPPGKKKQWGYAGATRHPWTWTDSWKPFFTNSFKKKNLASTYKSLPKVGMKCILCTGALEQGLGNGTSSGRCFLSCVHRGN